MTERPSSWTVVTVVALAFVVLFALVGPWIPRPRGAGLDLEAGGRFGVGLLSLFAYPVAVGAATVLGVLAGDVCVHRSRRVLLSVPLAMAVYGTTIGVAISMWWLGGVDPPTVQVTVSLAAGPFMLGYLFGAGTGWKARRSHRKRPRTPTR